MAKKQRTPKQVKQRFIIAVTLIGFMILINVGTNYRMRHAPHVPDRADTVEVLDRQLDSLLEAGYADAETVSYGDYGYTSRRTEAGMELKMLEDALASDVAWGEKTMKNYNERAAHLRGLLDTLPPEREKIVRSVTVKDNAAGRMLYCSQITDPDLLRSELSVRMTEPVGYSRNAEFEKIEKELNENLSSK